MCLGLHRQIGAVHLLLEGRVNLEEYGDFDLKGKNLSSSKAKYTDIVGLTLTSNVVAA